MSFQSNVPSLPGAMYMHLVVRHYFGNAPCIQIFIHVNPYYTYICMYSMYLYPIYAAEVGNIIHTNPLNLKQTDFTTPHSTAKFKVCEKLCFNDYFGLGRFSKS